MPGLFFFFSFSGLTVWYSSQQTCYVNVSRECAGSLGWTPDWGGVWGGVRGRQVDTARDFSDWNDTRWINARHGWKKKKKVVKPSPQACRRYMPAAQRLHTKGEQTAMLIHHFYGAVKTFSQNTARRWRDKCSPQQMWRADKAYLKVTPFREVKAPCLYRYKSLLCPCNIVDTKLLWKGWQEFTCLEMRITLVDLHRAVKASANKC